MTAESVMSDVADQIMRFRTAYLQAVSRATVDLEFRGKLTTSRDPLLVIKEAFGYECPWQIQLLLHDHSEHAPRVNPAMGTVMTQPHRGETITIYIPRRPKPEPHESPEHHVKQVMDALATYYVEHRWLFETRTRGSEDKHDPPSPLPLEGLPPAEWFSVAMLPNRNDRFDLGICVDAVLSFAAAMFNAVALAWDNAKFLELLIRPGAPGTAGKTIQLMDEWLGYKFPWDLELKIEIDEAARYESRNGRGKWTIRPPKVVLVLPWMTGATELREEIAANQRNPGVAIMGVALYNTDGPGYPFTCG